MSAGPSHQRHAAQNFWPNVSCAARTLSCSPSLLKQIHLHARISYLLRRAVPLSELTRNQRRQLAGVRDDEPDALSVFDRFLEQRGQVFRRQLRLKIRE